MTNEPNTTPTDAQPKAARPLGDEALREAEGLADRVWDQVGYGARLTSLKHAVTVEFARLLAFHPTAGQETVATPRDGGVREALAWYGEQARLARLIHSEGDSGRHALQDDGGKRALAALSAPGSAGPGEHIQHVESGGWYEVLTRDAQVQTKEPLADYAFVAVYRNVITGATWVRPLSEMDDGRFRPAPAHFASLATPSPAQEPGTGDTGAKERARKRIQALGAAMSRRDWSAAESAYEAIRDAHDRPEVYDAPLLATPSPAQEPGTGDTGAGLTLTALHEANIARQAEWCPDQVPDLSFRGNELAGETGEACNVIKKLERERQGWRGSRATMADLAEELADVVICADLCAVTAGIDLNAAVVAKFNATSDKVGISVRLPTPATTAETRGPAEGAR